MLQEPAIADCVSVQTVIATEYCLAADFLGLLVSQFEATDYRCIYI
ncbi:MAG: hypothetical protein ACFB0G_07305 [Leptolyngbyaceae cyanobacterium]